MTNQSPASTSSKFYPWAVVAMLWVVALLNYMDRQMLSTMQHSIGLDITAVADTANFGRLMAIFLWVYGCISPAAGAIADRINRKWLIVGSLAVWSTVTLLMGYCTTFTQIYWLRALMGVSEALYIPAGLALIADYFTGPGRSLAIGVHMTGLYAGQALGGFGATAAATWSWQQTFHWFGLIGIAYAIVLIVALHDRRRPVATNTPQADGPRLNPLRGFAMVLSNTAFWVVLFVFASSSLPGWSTKNWLPTLFADSLGLSPAEAGPLATITIAVASFAGVMIGGPMSDRWVRRNVRGRIYTSAIGMTMMIPALVCIGLGHNIYAAAGAALFFGVGYGMFDANNMPILCQFVPAQRRATAYGLMNMTGVFMGALVTRILGDWAEHGDLGLGFALMGGIVAIAITLQLTMLRPVSDNAE
ncbi:MAG: MFS transporter [Muribaculaceae bacterium]|nr:MFS transporter [Muribaculaceae bacterium]